MNDVIRAVNKKKVKHIAQETRTHLTALSPVEEQAINRIFSKISRAISLWEECGICNQHLYSFSINFHDLFTYYLI
ncbi:hypothetical protein QE152_g22532 [Popillia japonica]|uniref:Uncharacterized protein n=1 Tax=Popillia japonica TaxID=7064 RepID=A0AAW1KK93_POPJA